MVSLEDRVLEIAKVKGAFTADDLHVFDSELELFGVSRKIYGSVIAGLMHQRLIESVAFVRGNRPECHNRFIQVWRLTQ
ncbi:hypothetical protein [Candidatus Bathycorpusculum sp.]|uniref:hypothetical protein n=1 Tax=Candidatus Bathycorpusculum sp. TaxID=2994959 RepID=UPI00281B7163|nr:hypothetical protein [Candidatus Termitimicrobium sp.]MCL2432076.1 hypothetical protein [Candidatus Termitimicrobium sp.]